MAISTDIVGKEFGPFIRSYTFKDLEICALGCNAGYDGKTDLEYINEKDATNPALKFLPIFGVPLTVNEEMTRTLDYGYDYSGSLHYGFEIRLHAPFKMEDTIKTFVTQDALFDRGEGRDSILGEAAVSLFFLIGTFPAMFWLNSIGRRPLLIGSLAFMAVGLVILGVFPTAPVIVVILAFGLYAFFSGGPGILQWLYPNELFPTAVRASAVGIAISISRVGTIVSTYGTPLMLEQFGVGPTMLAAAALVVLGLVLSIFMAPETRGKSLAETSKVG